MNHRINQLIKADWEASKNKSTRQKVYDSTMPDPIYYLNLEHSLIYFLPELRQRNPVSWKSIITRWRVSNGTGDLIMNLLHERSWLYKRLANHEP